MSGILGATVGTEIALDYKTSGAVAVGDSDGNHLLRTITANDTLVVVGTVTCDILVVSGGGSGGQGRSAAGSQTSGGGGGAGGVRTYTNQTLSGSYTITIGGGATGSTAVTTPGTQGSPTIVTGGNTSYTFSSQPDGGGAGGANYGKKKHG